MQDGRRATMPNDSRSQCRKLLDAAQAATQRHIATVARRQIPQSGTIMSWPIPSKSRRPRPRRPVRRQSRHIGSIPCAIRSPNSALARRDQPFRAIAFKRRPGTLFCRMAALSDTFGAAATSAALEQSIRRSVVTHWELYQAALLLARRSSHPRPEDHPDRAFKCYCWALYRASEFASHGTDVGDVPWPAVPPS
jgi:hypothetical protein